MSRKLSGMSGNLQVANLQDWQSASRCIPSPLLDVMQVPHVVTMHCSKSLQQGRTKILHVVQSDSSKGYELAQHVVASQQVACHSLAQILAQIVCD